MKTTKTQSTEKQTSGLTSSISDKNKPSFFSGENEAAPLFFGPAGIQPKLEIGTPNDPYEREADAVADKVMRIPDPQVQRKCATCEQEDKEKLQRKPLIQRKATGSGTQTASSEVSSRISVTKGSGRSLDKGISTEMGSKMGADFSGVNIHTDSSAIQLSRDLGARAFTVGNDIYFNKGEYNPVSREGKHLLAHELTHVVQQESSKSLLQRQMTEMIGADGERVAVKPQPVTWDVDLGSMVSGAKHGYGEEEIAKINGALDNELENFTDASKKLFEKYNIWASEQSEELLQEFVQKMPSLGKAVLGAVYNELLGKLFSKNPVYNIAWKVLGYSISYLKEVQKVEENNQKVGRNTEESRKIFVAINRLEGKTIDSIITNVSKWVGTVQRALGNVEGDYADLSQRQEQIELLEKQEDQQKDISENIKLLRAHIKEDINQMEYHYYLAENAVTGLMNARINLVKNGEAALSELTSLFNAWQKQRRFFKDFNHNQPMRLFYWHPETNKISEIKSNKVSPEPVLATSSPLSSSRAQTISKEKLGEREKKIINDIEGKSWLWGRNFNNNFPHPDKIDLSSSFVKLYVYTGFWPDGIFHIMTKLSWSPFHVEIKNNRVVRWDFDNTNHPAMKAFFKIYRPFENKLFKASKAF